MRGAGNQKPRAIINYAFGTLKLGRILAGTEYDNAASIAVMRGLGMRIERNPHPVPEWFQVHGVLEGGSWVRRRSHNDETKKS
jgi:RimJ/RimL family protein N-acetyltransferase